MSANIEFKFENIKNYAKLAIAKETEIINEFK
jgi:hypothetical protein